MCKVRPTSRCEYPSTSILWALTIFPGGTRRDGAFRLDLARFLRLDAAECGSLADRVLVGQARSQLRPWNPFNFAVIELRVAFLGVGVLSNPFYLAFYHHLSSRSVPTLPIFSPFPFPIFWPTWKVSGKEEGANCAYCQLFSPCVPEIPKILISEM
jgi:hypothetical protein